MRVVLDTNVLVSGLLSPSGPPGRIVDLILAGEITLLVDDRLLAEYLDVLSRGRFGFDTRDVRALVGFLRHASEAVLAPPLATHLPDADDEAFLEVAVAGRADCLVTGNLRHFPKSARAGYEVVTPAGFLKGWRERSRL